MEEENHEKTNREKVLSPRTKKFWCYGCDRFLIKGGQKCPNCNKRYGRRRFK